MSEQTESTPDNFKFKRPVQIRFRDLDALGHVNNAVYITYFEMAREGYVKAIKLASDASAPADERFPFIIAEISCTFLAPVTLDTDLVVYLRTSRMGNSSFDFDYLLVDEASNCLMARGKSVQVSYDYKAGKPVRLPDEIRGLIEAYETKNCA